MQEQNDILLNQLPLEILESIFLKLDIKSALNLLSTNKVFRKLDEDPLFWRQMLYKHFPSTRVTYMLQRNQEEKPDYKRLFKNFYLLSQGQLYRAIINTPEAIEKDGKIFNSLDAKDGSDMFFFERIAAIINNNMHKHDDKLPYIFLYQGSIPPSITEAVKRGFYQEVTLRVPQSFKPHQRQINPESSSKWNYFNEKIKPNHIEWLVDKNNEKILNPMFYQLGHYDWAKKLLIKISKHFTSLIPKSFLSKMINFISPNINHVIAESLSNLVLTASNFKDLFIGLHAITRKLSHDKLTEYASIFFNHLNISYNPQDSDLEFLKKCQDSCYISTVILEELQSAKETKSISTQKTVISALGGANNNNNNNNNNDLNATNIDKTTSENKNTSVYASESHEDDEEEVTETQKSGFLDLFKSF